MSKECPCGKKCVMVEFLDSVAGKLEKGELSHQSFDIVIQKTLELYINGKECKYSGDLRRYMEDIIEFEEKYILRSDRS